MYTNKSNAPWEGSAVGDPMKPGFILIKFYGIKTICIIFKISLIQSQKPSLAAAMRDNRSFFSSLGQEGSNAGAGTVCKKTKQHHVTMDTKKLI